MVGCSCGWLQERKDDRASRQASISDPDDNFMAVKIQRSLLNNDLCDKDM
jgi:hypothetical protein